MKWVSHQAVTGTAVYLLTDNPAWAVAAMQGAVLPDALEWVFPGHMIPHRTLTHWWPVYVLPALVLYGYAGMRGVPLMLTGPELYRVGLAVWHGAGPEAAVYGWLPAVFWLLAGAVCHLVEDLTTGYLPGWSPWDRPKHHYRRRLFYPGSPKEAVFVILCCLFMLGIKGLTFRYGFFL